MYRCNNCFEEFDKYHEECPSCGYRYGDSPKLSYQLFAGTELKDGKYIIGKVIGSGGFGNIYKAWDTRNERVVAIKEFYLLGVVNRPIGEKALVVTDKRRAWEFETLRDRTIQEARTTAEFSSEPDIVNVFDYIEENNTAYIVMEFLDGINLSEYIKLNGHFDVEDGIKLCVTVSNALEKIHSKGIIHRDISPDNIFMCLDGGVKLIDFGAAKLTQNDNLELLRIVKPGFAPPEQYVKGGDEGVWTDVYALAGTLYYLITGVLPVEATNRKQTDDDIEKDDMPFPHEIDPNIPEYISNAIMNAMEPDIQLRLKSVMEFRSAITKEKILLSPKKERKKKRRKKYIGLGTAVAVIALGTGISVHMMHRNIDEETLPECTITMWYCKSGNTEYDEAEKNAYEKIISDFNISFENVTIELQGFDSDEYEKKLSTSDEYPDLYEFEGNISSGKRLDMKRVFTSEEAKLCPLLKDVEKVYGDNYQLPLGFDAPVIYENTVLNELKSDKVGNITEMIGKTSGRGTALFETRELSDDMGDKGCNYSEDALEMFLNKDTGFLGGYTSDFYTIRENMPAQYELLYLDIDKVPCRYDNVWCANDNGSDKSRAVLKFMEFMLTNNAQDELHVQNKSKSLPINDDVLNVFVSVHGEFDGFFDNKDRYSFS